MGMVASNPLIGTEQRIRELTMALEAADQRGDHLELELKAERRKNSTVEKGVAELRSILSPLYRALGMVFGQIEVMGVSETAANGPAASVISSPRATAAWESWKQKLGPNSAAAKIIDILMIHGELTHTQLRIHIGTSRMQTVYDAVSKLNKAALLNKNGDKFSLKEL
jgi:hypothetical protein